MIFDIYLRHRDRKLPLWVTIILVVGLSLLVYLRGLVLSVILVVVLSYFSIRLYKEHYWRMAKHFVTAAVVFGLMTFDSSKFLGTFFKVVAYVHLSFLFAYLCPPASFENKTVRVCFVFLPYFENHTRTLIQSGQIKGLNLRTRNPLKFIVQGVKLAVPLFVILLETMREVEIALKVKGFSD